MRRPMTVLAACAPLLVLAGLAVAQDGPPLRLAVDGPVRLIVERTEELTRPGRSSTARVKSMTQVWVIQRGEDTDDGDLRLKVTLERVRGRIRTPEGGERTIDTASPHERDGPEARSVGRDTVCRVSPRGDVIGVDEALGTPVTNLPREQRCRLAGLAGDGVVGNTVLGFLTPFPEAAPTVGTSWSTRAIVRGPGAVGAVALLVSNTVAEVRPELVVVHQSAVLDPDVEVETSLVLRRCEARAVVSRADGLIVEGTGTLILEIGEGDDRLVVRSSCHRRRQQ